MAHRYNENESVARDRRISADDHPDDEFDDELTAPVIRDPGTTGRLRDDRRDVPADVPDQPRDASPPEDDPPDDPVVEDPAEDPVADADPAEELVADADLTEEAVADADSSDTSTAAEDGPLEPGFVLRDRFEIVGLVHTGGMSHVYKAIDRRRLSSGSEHSHVAIKILRPSALPERDMPAALEREAAQAQRLSHPNIVNIFDFDVHDEQFYLVMEWLQGESLKELLQRTSGQQLAPEFAWQIIHGVAGALEHAHSNNVVHADINLSNIFITDTKQIKLLDFGVSRGAMDNEDVAADEQIWVTHKYASPEVLLGSVPVFTDDIFALGCVAYRLLSGRHPFACASSLRAKASGLTPLPVPGLSARQWRTLEQALQFKRSDRPTTAAVFLGEQPARTGEIMRRVGDTTRRAGDSMRRVGDTMRRAGNGLRRVGDTTRRAGDSMRRARENTRRRMGESLRRVWDNLRGKRDNLRRGAGATTRRIRHKLRSVRDNVRIPAVPRNAWLVVAGLAAAALAAGLWALLPAAPTDEPIITAQPPAAIDEPAVIEAAPADAAETDPGNPATAIVSERLTASADEQLADPPQASADEDVTQAAATLSEGEPDPPVDVQESEAAGEQVVVSNEEQRFVEALAQVEEHMAARRLTLPADGNAHALVLELREQYGNDDRLRASMDRLGDQLLAEALAASTAGDDASARRLLDAAESLDLDPGEIEETRQVLAANAEPAPDTQPAVAAAPDPSPDQPAAPTATEPEPALAAAADTATAEVVQDPDTAAADIPAPEEQAASTAAEPEPALAAARDPAPTEASPEADSPATEVPSEPRYVSLEELQIEKYVAPVYPLKARRRGLTGNVEMNFRILADGSTDEIEIISSRPGDIFVAAATKAVSKWRFAPPGEILSAQVTVRFDEE